MTLRARVGARVEELDGCPRRANSALTARPIQRLAQRVRGPRAAQDAIPRRDEIRHGQFRGKIDPGAGGTGDRKAPDEVAIVAREGPAAGAKIASPTARELARR